MHLRNMGLQHSISHTAFMRKARKLAGTTTTACSLNRTRCLRCRLSTHRGRPHSSRAKHRLCGGSWARNRVTCRSCDS